MLKVEINAAITLIHGKHTTHILFKIIAYSIISYGASLLFY